MTWFRIDDDFDQHPKVEAAGNRAIGLWARAGAYSSRLLTEGFVPTAMVPKLGGTRRDAAALVDAGLWVEVEGGYRFHQWTERNPTRAKVLADREAAAERQRRARDRASESRRDSGSASRRDSDPASRRDTPDPSRRESRSPRPGPARPDPENPLLTYVGRLAGGDATDLEGLPAEVLDAWQERAGDRVDLVAEARAYLAWCGDRPARNPRAAWLGWLDKARQRAASSAAAEERRATCPDPSCSGGWLPPVDDRPRPCPSCRPHLRAVDAS